MKLHTTFLYYPALPTQETVKPKQETLRDIKNRLRTQLAEKNLDTLRKQAVEKCWPFPQPTKPVVKQGGNAWPIPEGQAKAKSVYEMYYGMGVRIVHVVGHNGKGGVTLAYRKTSEYESSNMVEVSVAYCSRFDTFSKKIGTENALRNWKAGLRIMVPARTGKDDYTIPHNLRDMFWYNIGGE